MTFLWHKSLDGTGEQVVLHVNGDGVRLLVRNSVGDNAVAHLAHADARRIGEELIAAAEAVGE